MEHTPACAALSRSQARPVADDDQLVTTEEAARLLDLKPATLTNWRCTNRVRIPYVKIGGRHVRYRLSDIKAFQLRCLVGADHDHAEG